MPLLVPRLPPPRFLRTLLVRGAALWVLSHLMAKSVLAMKGAFAARSAFETTAAHANGDSTLPIWVLVMSVSLMFVDLHRRKEVMLLNNLGVATAGGVLVGVTPAIVGEALLLTLIR